MPEHQIRHADEAHPALQEPVLGVHDVSFAFGAKRVLNCVSLSISSGEILALLGPNGAGKTTLIRTVVGQARPLSGTVRVCGADPAATPEARRRIGLVPQQIALYPTLTCAENLRMFGALAGMPRKRARERANAVLAAIAMETRADERVNRLSGGMARRINIGVAILHDPKLLILDEPTVGVDLHAREAIHDLLAGLRARGMAMLLATHDMGQAEALADRVAIMTEGVIRLEGRPAALIDHSFGGAKEAVIELAAAPTPAAAALLAELALRPVGGRNTWVGPILGGAEGLRRLEGAVASGIIVARSIGLRAPDLGSVFFRNVGRNLDL